MHSSSVHAGCYYTLLLDGGREACAIVTAVLPPGRGDGAKRVRFNCDAYEVGLAAPSQFTTPLAGPPPLTKDLAALLVAIRDGAPPPLGSDRGRYAWLRDIGYISQPATRGTMHEPTLTPEGAAALAAVAEVA